MSTKKGPKKKKKQGKANKPKAAVTAPAPIAAPQDEVKALTQDMAKLSIEAPASSRFSAEELVKAEAMFSEWLNDSYVVHTVHVTPNQTEKYIHTLIDLAFKKLRGEWQFEEFNDLISFTIKACHEAMLFPNDISVPYLYKLSVILDLWKKQIPDLFSILPYKEQLEA